MIPFALRLAASGGREALARLAMIAAAVALGVGLLLSTLASLGAVDRSNERQLWLNTGAASRTETAAVDPLWWWAHSDYHAGRQILQVDVAATGPTAPVPPGLDRLPAPGEYVVSPALAELLRATPATQLADRLPGRLAGTIGDDALASPDALIAVIGRTPAEISDAPGARAVTTVADALPPVCGSDCPGSGVRGDAMTLLLAVAAGAMIFPVAIFIGTATQLSAATREQRYAAMRLVGATPRQVSVISAVESSLAAVAGTALGFALFFALRPLVATVPFTGDRFFAADLTFTATQAVMVALGVPVAAAVAARLALRRLIISPLGVARRVTPRPPSAWRLAPLLAGLGELALFLGHRPATSGGQLAAYLPGFLLVMAGLVIAGPWLTMAAARAVARRTNRPATLIAVRRLADDPKAGFRSVSGLVLALFVVTATVSIIGAINANRGTLGGDEQTRTAVAVGGFPEEPPLADAVPDQLLADLRAVEGFRGLTVVHADTDESARDPADPVDFPPPGLVLCSDLARVPVAGHCSAGASVAAVWAHHFLSLRSNEDVEWPAAAISPEEVGGLPVQLLYVTTDGSTAAMEQTRTLLTTAYPRFQARTVDDWASDQQRTLAGWRQLANVVLLATLPIAGCGLAVSVVAGLSDRRRPFAMLRLAGAPLPMLRRVIGLESVLPLLAVAVISIGAAFAASAMFLRSQLRYDLVSPGATYYALVGLGLAASLGIIASTLPLLRRITGPDAARNG
ncbi:ABC transporter permease [Frankia sp. CNm7]|uniref:ABC transporter permease n=1 Tax=Frankia nepalensis TaxID=1836974 RepID=A0A937UQI7_9ACTN|nr:FtsX-like permease family protein [Frankia nepalensis]MBL7500070.1 ABC transporter permease [Frankia nepalensis]MBL7509396.1 ABC transporter permease [Frankia nepalensis]MBL7522849.1 ABC transporter permease [Frankia nepalensis]MBL7631889.1 ABC transporter permease [Frankia nepalensis]